LKRQNLISCVICALGFAVYANSQAVPTASRSGALQIGAGFSYGKPDYTETAIKGPTAYATFDINQHLGAEADIHYVSLIAPGKVGEDSYLIGPRYVFTYKRFMPYAKVLVGLGDIKLDFNAVPHSSLLKFVYAGGAGLDFRVIRNINLRAIDFEYQQWPNFQPHGLSPYILTAGAAYVFR
jgi:hypothetical protein